MKNKLILLVSFFAVVFLLGSCLKDDVGEYWKDDLAGKMYVTVATPTLQQMPLQPVAGEVEYQFLLNVATDALPTEDITVTLGVDTAAVTYYNQANIKWNKANPTLPPKVVYSKFPNVEVLTKTLTIPKGTRTITAKTKVWGAETLNACDNFISAVSIQSAKTASGNDVTIAGNMKSYLLALPIANPYAGNYVMTLGYRIRPGNPTEQVAAGTVQTFNTVNCKTVQKNGFGNYSAFDISIEVTQETVVVGGVTCYKVIATPIDPATGGSVGGMFSAWKGDTDQKPADLTINYYNPSTKTFVLNCYYTSSAGDRIMYEVLTRQ